MSRIINAFHSICSEQKNKLAFFYLEKGKRKCKTFGELFKDTEQTVQYLSASGVKYGDRILAFAAPSYRLCVFMLASLRLGASLMYVDIWAKQDKLKSVFSDYRPDYLLVSNQTKYLKIFFREIRKIKRVINVDTVSGGNAIPLAENEIGEETVALLTMTTGSTGKPKIVIRTHRNLYEQLKLINENLDASGEQTVLTTSFIYVFSNVMSGFTTVLPQVNLSLQSKRKLNGKLAKFSDLPITMIMTSPDFCLKTDNLYPSLKQVFFGGAILNIKEAKAILNKYGQAEITYIYGATECNLISSTRLATYAEKLERERHCVLGNVVRGVQVKIGGNNEIMVSSSALLENYLVQDLSNKTKDGQTVWHNTGDTGAYENGVLYYLGRSKYEIQTDGGKFYSNQIEQNVILQFQELDKCAVLQYNGVVYLFVECSEKCNLTDVEVYLKETFQIEKLRVKKLKKIPCDVKHHTKINYNKLMKRIN
ncbi:MAG: acyl--CoA ligase [Clostridia bacterium]|nr:acyl--CoA ligase [Clostridia bacterium]